MTNLINNGKLFFIVNPVSGNGKTQKKFLVVIETYLQDKNIEYEKVYTQYKGHAIALAKQVKARNDIKTIIAVGGDGTLFEVINGLYQSDIPVGYIPTGTGNDYGRAIGIPPDPILAIERVLSYDNKKMDVGEINGNYFANVASMGFDADVVKCVNDSSIKSIFGNIAYAIGAISVLIKFKPKKLKLIVDGSEYNFDNVWLVAVANNKYYGGGMLISPNSINNDGFFDICIIKDLKKLKFLMLFTSVFKGNHIKHYPLVEFIKGKDVEIESQEELAVQADGEIFTNTNLKLRNIKNGLNTL